MEAWLARAARMHGDRAALETDAGVTTYAELYRRARAAAGALQQREVSAGDKVALALSARGVSVRGIELSPHMVDQLRAKPGGDRVIVQNRKARKNQLSD